MTRDELDIAGTWAQKEGWVTGLHDADSFWAVDPHGFFVAELQNEIVGFISAVAYDKTYGFVGLFIVRADHRGSKVGVHLYETALNYLGNRIIGADGVTKKLKNYAALGFIEQYRIIRHQGIAQSKPFTGVIAAQQISFDQLLSYDQQCSPVPRASMLRNWINQPESRTLCSLHNNIINGFGTIRRCSTDYEIGPLFADSPDIAINLINALVEKIVGQNYYIKMPMSNKFASKLIAEYDFKMLFEVGRIYRNGVPALPLDKIFATTSFEVG